MYGRVGRYKLIFFIKEGTMLTRIILASLLFHSFIYIALAQNNESTYNWPTWRGPNSNGVSSINSTPPIKWDEKTNIKWKTKLPGKGSSSPIIWGNNVFVLTAIKTDRLAKAEELPKRKNGLETKTIAPQNFYNFDVLCFDKTTGKLNWSKTANTAIPHEGHHSSHSYAASSPVTDGHRLYASFGSFGYYAFDFFGNLLWKRDLGRLTTRLGWGETVTPALFKNSLVLNLDQEIGSKIVVLDASTGKTIWEKDRNEKSSWNTPFIVPYKNINQVIINGTTQIRSYDLNDGKIIWETSGMTTNAIPSVLASSEIAYVMSGYRGAAAVAIPLSSNGELSESAESKNSKALWRYSKGTPYVPSPLLFENNLYFTKGNSGLLTILDALNGKAIVEDFRLENTSTFYSSPVTANGMIYFIDRDGTAIIIKCGKVPKIISTNKLNDQFDASPAISGNTLFLRGENWLYAIEEK